MREFPNINKITSKGKLAPRILFLFNDLILVTQKKLGKHYLREKIEMHMAWVKPLPDAESLFLISFIINNVF